MKCVSMFDLRVFGEKVGTTTKYGKLFDPPVEGSKTFIV